MRRVFELNGSQMRCKKRSALCIAIDAGNSNPRVIVTQMQGEVPVYQHKSITATGETLGVVREVAVNDFVWRVAA